MTDNNIQRYEYNEDRNGMYEVLLDQFNSWILHITEDHLKAMEAKQAELEEYEILISNATDNILNGKKKDETIESQAKEIERLKDFVIWLTGSDYDFTQHPYYIEKMKELIHD